MQSSVDRRRGANAEDWDLVTGQFMKDSGELDMLVQPAKCGHVATTAALSRLVDPMAKRLGVVKKQAIRNPGHDMHGQRAWRLQGQQGLKAVRARKKKPTVL